MAHAPRPMAERFWARVTRGAGNSCWEWTGPTLPKGYGTITSGRASGHPPRQLVHRVSWEMHNGPIPDGLWVLHHCDNPPCIRPDHLFLGTAADNNADMRQKGRWRGGFQKGRAGRKGEDNSGTKLTNADIHEIRSLRATGVTLLALGNRFGVSPSVIWKIAQGKTWTHLANTAVVAPARQLPPDYPCGHPRTSENTYPYSPRVDTWAVCKTCRNARGRAYHARQRQQQLVSA